MKYFHVSFCQLQEAVHQPKDRQRLFTSSCRKFIRAAAGHSIPVNLTNFAQSIDNPAQVRYCCHGTSLHAYSQIKEEENYDHTVYTLCIVQRTTKEEFGGSHNPQRQEVPTRRYVVVSSTRWKHCCYRKQKRRNKALFLPMRNN